MATELSPSQVVGRALEFFNEAFRPFVVESLRHVFGDRWFMAARNGPNFVAGADTEISEVQMLDGRFQVSVDEDPLLWDTRVIIHLVLAHWQRVFSPRVPALLRSFLFHMKEIRNQWAHQSSFSWQDAYRSIDLVELILKYIGSDQIAEYAAVLRRQVLFTYAQQEMNHLQHQQRLASLVLNGVCSNVQAPVNFNPSSHQDNVGVLAGEQDRSNQVSTPPPYPSSAGTVYYRHHLHGDIEMHDS
eukprot:GILK01012520.1.p1 GENE.GILK01012520.1~~GILK01012520.1.p1  ORF type:complete len:253 (-),score=30.85 GILK01012520.1:311-1042(-)